MTKFYKDGKWYYTTHQEVYEERNPQERVYYDANMKAYYIVKPTKRPRRRYK